MKLPVMFPKDYTDRIQKLFGSSIISHLPLDEPLGTVAFDASPRRLNGACTAVTRGSPGPGNGILASSFDGSTSFCNWYSAALASAFNGAEGTLMAWVNIPAAAWTDGAVRQLVSIQADANNFVRMRKSSTNNIFNFQYSAGATLDAVNSANFASATWVFLAQTWSASADQLKAYLNGVQQGTTQTTLGTFAGTPAATTTMIGSLSTGPGNVWSGLIAHAVLLNRAATAAEIQEAYRLAGV